MDVLPSLKLMLINDEDLRVGLIRDVGLEVEELAFLMNTKVDSKEVKAAFAAAEGSKTQIPDDDRMTVAAEAVLQAQEPAPVKAQSKKQKSLFDF